MCDALVVDSNPVVVRECSGSQTLQVGTQVGFRIMQVREHLELSGAAYPFSILAGPGVLATLREAQARLRAEPVLPKVLGLAIISGWLRQFLAPPPIPALMDAHSGEPIRLITAGVRIWPHLHFAYHSAGSATPRVVSTSTFSPTA